MLPTKSNQDYRQRKEAIGQTIWYPLPKNIIANIFDPELMPIILNKFSTGLGDLGSWNPEHGIYAHHKSGLLFCLAATEQNLVTLDRFLAGNQNIWNIKASLDGSIDDKLLKIRRLSEVIGAAVAVIQPVEYGIHNIPTLIKKHFADNPGYIFIRDQGTNFPGSIRVRSLPTEQGKVNLPDSHPGLAPESIVKSQQDNLRAKGKFAISKSLLDAMYETSSTTKYVPNVNPGPDSITEPIENHMIYKEGAHEFLNDGSRQIPLLTIGNDTVGHTASVVYRGTPHESTLTALVSNPLTTLPSSSFNPHPYWLSSIFSTPFSVLRDPKAAAAIIAIALLSSQDKTQYIANVNRVTTVVDNEEIDRDLYG